MTTNLPDESVWAAGVAARLRLLQVTCAEAPAAQRREFLGEAVAEAADRLPADRRDTYLAALAERFPAWTGAAPPHGTPLPAAPLTPEGLVDQLAACAPELPPETKAALARKLLEAGLLPEAPAPASEGAENLKRALGLPEPPTLEQAARLLAVLADLLEKLDQLACTTYENLPTRPDFKTVNADDFREAIRNFLGGDGGAGGEAAEAALQKVIEKHGRAMVALMASLVGVRGVPSVGREFARGFLELFSPQSIEDVARAERGSRFGLGGGLEERCWRKYAQQFRQDYSTPEHVDKKVKDAAANTIERIFQLRL